MKIRLQKFIADSGYCSRRMAEQLILNKKVKVNGKIAEIGTSVSDKDVVNINNKTIFPIKEKIYIAFNKPKGYICSNKTNSTEKSIFDILPFKEKLFVAGRLDKDSHGLVILTNDGGFAYKITHPSFSHEKEYEVTVDKSISKETLKKLQEGVDIKEKTLARMKSIKKIGNKKYNIILTEGKNRQIRRSLGSLSYTVLDIKRIRINNYIIGKIKKGSWKKINPPINQ